MAVCTEIMRRDHLYEYTTCIFLPRDSNKQLILAVSVGTFTVVVNDNAGSECSAPIHARLDSVARSTAVLNGVLSYVHEK